ncbi:hypothetical protein BVG19_g4094 [[Candida] boidinii]|nr:hypothetical protein BVG19_g4094 [[Candida] boidinii]OWB52910.1 hypothetical protein B5S27_g4493 [[Candida] boidinii]
MTRIDEIDSLQTETRNRNSENLDLLPVSEIVKLMNSEDKYAVEQVTKSIPEISEAIESIYPKIANGGRLIYIGAGSSARIGVMDISELEPTYSADPSQFIAFIAGGDTALRNPVPGAEDSTDEAIESLKKLELTENDTVVGIASSGRTPYVISGLNYAKDNHNCLTIAISCVSPSKISTECNVDHLIEVVTGPEILTGSTRLKAGTVTKLILNTISTTVMVKLGKTYDNLMVDMKPSNEKLFQRSISIFKLIVKDYFYYPESISQSQNNMKLNAANYYEVWKDWTKYNIQDSNNSSTLINDKIKNLIIACENKIKIAVVVSKFKTSVLSAKDQLARSQNSLRKTLQTMPSETGGILETEKSLQDVKIKGYDTIANVSNGKTNSNKIINLSDYRLCIDGGGSKTVAVITNIQTSERYTGTSGPSNVNNIELDKVVHNILEAILIATSKVTDVESDKIILFSKCLIGLAGYKSADDRAKERLRNCLSKNFMTSNEADFIIVSDIILLAFELLKQEHKEKNYCIGFVCGTGCGAMLFEKQLVNRNERGDGSPITLKDYVESLKMIRASGGWGSVLGDDGGGYKIGLAAVKRCLNYFDDFEDRSIKFGDLSEVDKEIYKLYMNYGENSFDFDDVNDNNNILVDKEQFLTKILNMMTDKARVATIAPIASIVSKHKDKEILMEQSKFAVNTVKRLLLKIKHTIDLSGNMNVSNNNKELYEFLFVTTGSLVSFDTEGNNYYLSLIFDELNTICSDLNLKLVHKSIEDSECIEF